MYRFTDRSLVRPALTRIWFARLFPLLPGWLAANLVTILSTGTLLIVLGLSIEPARWSPVLLAVAFFVATQVYVAGDHLDGMQAKASGTASPLGDFLDHYCDLWAGCILVFGFWSLLDSASRTILYSLQGLLILGFAVTYAEREERQTLYFTKYGTLEAIVILSAFLVSWTAPAARSWWQSDLVAGLPWYAVPIAAVVLMAVGAIGAIVRRLGMVPPSVALFTVGLAALVIVLSRRGDLRPIEGWLLIAAYGSHYSARVMHGYLVPGRRSWPDAIATGLAIGLVTWDLVDPPSTELLRPVMLWTGAYVVLVAAIALVRVVGSLRRYWVWVNATDATAL